MFFALLICACLHFILSKSDIIFIIFAEKEQKRRLYCQIKNFICNRIAPPLGQLGRSRTLTDGDRVGQSRRQRNGQRKRKTILPTPAKCSAPRDQPGPGSGNGKGSGIGIRNRNKSLSAQKNKHRPHRENRTKKRSCPYSFRTEKQASGSGISHQKTSIDLFLINLCKTHN